MNRRNLFVAAAGAVLAWLGIRKAASDPARIPSTLPELQEWFGIAFRDLGDSDTRTVDVLRRDGVLKTNLIHQEYVLAAPSRGFEAELARAMYVRFLPFAYKGYGIMWRKRWHWSEFWPPPGEPGAVIRARFASADFYVPGRQEFGPHPALGEVHDA